MSHWQHSTVISYHCRMESTSSYLIVATTISFTSLREFIFHLFMIYLNNVKGSEFDCLNHGMATSHVRVLGLKQQFVYK